MKKKKYVYVVRYLDSKEGDMTRTTVIAEEESEAIEKAMDDYYFGSFVDIECNGEATAADIAEYS